MSAFSPSLESRTVRVPHDYADRPSIDLGSTVVWGDTYAELWQAMAEHRDASRALEEADWPRGAYAAIGSIYTGQILAADLLRGRDHFGRVIPRSSGSSFADAIVAADEARMDRGDVEAHATQRVARMDAVHRARTPREISVKLGGRYAVAIFRRTPAPIMGGSPYAGSSTGWHAEGCLCRRCAA